MSLDAALTLARKGFRVFPCINKKPARTGWQASASTDPEVIAADFAGTSYTVGVYCGGSGLLVVDEDQPDAFGKYAAEHGHSIPATYAVKTARGRHLYFRAPPGDPGNATGGLPAGIDIRGRGGYVIGAGSTRADGATYEAENDLDPADCPQWLADALQQPVSAPVEPYDGPGYTDLPESERRTIERWTRAAVDGIQAELRASTGWQANQRDERGRGWEKLQADAALRLGALARAAWCPLTVEQARQAFTDGAPTDGAWTKGDVAAKWSSQHARGASAAKPELSPTGGVEPEPEASTNVDNDETHRGQLRMAYRLVTAYRDRLRHVHGVGWHAWDGQRWKADLDGAATRAVLDVVTASYASLAGLDRDAERELLSDIHKCESATGVDGVLRIAGSIKPLATSYDALNADPYLFNCQSGTLDLRSGELRAHDPDDLITKVAGCGYDPDARSETFDGFLTEIQPDADMRAFIARVFGHALVGKVIEHKLPILTGVGQNGKSTLVDAVAETFGDYAIAAEPELLVERGAAHTTGQADLLGVRLAVCSETDGGRRLAAATVKRLTGGDKIRARRMRQDNIEFAPSHTALMVTNHKPVVSGNDPALWRRLRIVPFDVIVPEPDLGLPERLSLDLSAVLAWIVAGYRDWQSHGLSEPEAVTSATDEYKASSDDLGRFIDEACIENPHMYVKARELFSVWSVWTRDNGIDSGTEVAFAAVMAEKGFTKKRTNRGQTYQGISLAAQEEI